MSLSRNDENVGEKIEHSILEMNQINNEPQSLPFVLSFTNLTYSVKVRGKFGLPAVFGGRKKLKSVPATASEPVGGENLLSKSKVLLNDISGVARDGEILAVLGASGSGKSTLIDALANRIAKGSLKGTITLNGEQLESKMLKVISAYVMQDDLLFPMLTVEETLMFAAEFRLPRTLSKSKKKQRVEALIDQLGLRNAANTVIGDEGHRGVSGGERRRVSIGTDIIHDPIILFLDEPTSGLDSTSAYMVVKVLQRIAQTGSIVIITLSAGNETPTHGLSLKEAITASISRGKLVSGATTDASHTSMVPNFANPMWMEIAVLSKRSFKNSLRMPEIFATRLGAVMVTGFILATIFWKLDNSPRGARERLGFFAFAMSTTFYTCADALPIFIQERFIFMRETAYNAYRRSSYVLSHSLVAIPALIFLSITFAIITFWAVGLDGGASGFFFYFLIILASFWAGSSFVTFLSAVVSHVMIGYVIVVAILAYFLLFSGFFIDHDRIPVYWIWFHYISLIKYPYQAVLNNEFQDPTKCFVRGTQIFDGSPLSYADESLKLKMLENMGKTLGFNLTGTTCLTTGTDLLKQQGVVDLGKWDCLWITMAWGFLFRILFYFCLLLGSKNKRR
ncbi:hypothetical protein E3N88_03184 [Mikania micrantha]|uniref:ABC transporter domain-containing protein n=1 Tax=Mikania micrantha TaxID=192012 RepID=A0A5N6Q855_9ASTR|nr:hypothetical protein E3N88_03184 [Mikania micrantha]